MKIIQSLLLIITSFLSPVYADNFTLEKVNVGDRYKNRYGNEIEIKSFSFKVDGNKCIGKMTIHYIATQRTVIGDDEYKASTTKEGILCNNGKYTVKRPDGMIESGSLTFDYLIKKGIAYRIRK
jgi:hypothetical protein